MEKDVFQVLVIYRPPIADIDKAIDIMSQVLEGMNLKTILLLSKV